MDIVRLPSTPSSSTSQSLHARISSVSNPVHISMPSFLILFMFRIFLGNIYAWRNFLGSLRGGVGWGLGTMFARQGDSYKLEKYKKYIFSWPTKSVFLICNYTILIYLARRARKGKMLQRWWSYDRWWASGCQGRASMVVGLDAGSVRSAAGPLIALLCPAPASKRAEHCQREGTTRHSSLFAPVPQFGGRGCSYHRVS